MTGTAIDIKVDDKGLKKVLSRFLARVGHAEPAMKIIGQIIRTSVVENFQVAGRPETWKALADNTLLTKKGGKVLIEQGFAAGLMGSIHEEISADSVLVGTDKVYAAIHHFGGMAGRGRKVKIPARPYMMIQDEDWPEIVASLEDYLLAD